SSDRLLLLHKRNTLVSSDELRAADAMATSSVWMLRNSPPALASRWWPEGLEAKAAMLRILNSRLIERSRFVDSALRSVEDGLVIAGPDGLIRFANPRAAIILASKESTLIGRNLFHL